MIKGLAVTGQPFFRLYQLLRMMSRTHCSDTDMIGLLAGNIRWSSSKSMIEELQPPVLPGSTTHKRMTVTRLTAPGRGAVATVRVSCTELQQAHTIDVLFQAANGMLAVSAPVNRILYGTWQGEGVVVVRTAELQWEIHCHGGEAAVSRIIDELPNCVVGDATQHPPFEQLLLQTRTTKTARLALAQANGLLHKALTKLAQSTTFEDAQTQIEQLMKYEEAARHLTSSWQIVIVGPPNAGKSSLLNAIAGFDRSIVFDQPGTTRDAVQAELVIHGWPCCFCDTAGIRRQSEDPIEQLGISHAIQLLQTAELVLVAVDNTVGWTDEHDRMLAQVPVSVPTGVVICKSDLASDGRPPPQQMDVLSTSAEQTTGLRELTEWIMSQLLQDEPDLHTALPVCGAEILCQELLVAMDAGQPMSAVREVVTSWLSALPDPTFCGHRR